MANRSIAQAALRRLKGWRSILAAWQLGTKSKGTPAYEAVQDHRGTTLSLRADVDTLIAVLVSKGILTYAEYLDALAMVADRHNAGMSQDFPGATITDQGIELDREQAAPWMARFPQ